MTTHAVVTVFANPSARLSVISASVVDAVLWDVESLPWRNNPGKINPNPMRITTAPPTANTASCSHSYRCMSAPMPKKHDRDSATSNMVTMIAVNTALRLVLVSAELMTNRFCMPIGATYASPIVSPCK